MPKSPPWLSKVKFIRFFLSNGCNTPWAIYFETGAESLGRQILVLISTSMDDIIRALFKPKGLRSGRHGRKSRRGGKQSIPEASEVIAEIIPGQEARRSRAVSDGAKNLWIIDGIFQEILYYVMIVDIIEDFWYDWLVGIVKADQTYCENMGRGMRKGSPSVNNSGGWGSLKTDIIVYNHYPVDVGDATVVLGPGKFMVTFTGDAKQWIPNPGGAQAGLGISVIGGHNEFLDKSSIKDISFDSQTQFITTAYVNGPALLALRAYSQTTGINTGVLWTEQVCFAMQMDN